MNDAIIKAIGSAIVGGLLGWSANALTLAGRVAAIEAGQTRLEAKVDRLLDRGAEHIAQGNP